MPLANPDAPSAGARGCHAAAGCTEQACFQVRFEALIGRCRVSRWANACAAHIGVLARDITVRARDGELADGMVTVLAIDPAAEFRLAAGAEPGPLWPGFAFSTLPIAHTAHPLAHTAER